MLPDVTDVLVSPSSVVTEFCDDLSFQMILMSISDES